MGRIVLVCLMVIAFGGIATIATARDAHFPEPPTCVDAGTKVRCAGSIEELDEGRTRLAITAVGVAEFACIDATGRRGRLQEGTIVSLGKLDLGQARDGRIAFRKRMTEPPADREGNDVCPDGRRARVTDVEFTTATLRVLSGGKVVVGPVTVGVD